MAKCKNCIKLMDCVEMRDGKDLEFKWCDVIDDCPDIECERDCLHYEAMTQADRIRSMTDEELKELLLCNLCESMGFDECPQDDEFFDESTLGKICGNCVMTWLKSEAGCE